MLFHQRPDYPRKLPGGVSQLTFRLKIHFAEFCQPPLLVRRWLITGCVSVDEQRPLLMEVKAIRRTLNCQGAVDRSAAADQLKSGSGVT